MIMKKLSVDKASSDKLKAAILPPRNNTCEPVILPLDFNLRLYNLMTSSPLNSNQSFIFKLTQERIFN